MSRIYTLLALASAMLASACASDPQTTSAAKGSSTNNEASAAVAAPPMTGSRLVKRNTDRSLRSVDSQTFKQDTDIRGRGNDLGLN